MGADGSAAVDCGVSGVGGAGGTGGIGGMGGCCGSLMALSVAAPIRSGKTAGSPVGVSRLGAAHGVAVRDAAPVGRHGMVAVAADLEDRGDGGPGNEGGEEDEEYHGRNATVNVNPPRVAE